MSAASRVWQISGGPAVGGYADLFLHHQVALVGPGDTGPWRADRPGFEVYDDVRRMADEVREGDVLLLRTGPGTVVSVGIVAGPYQYFEQFDDVNGLAVQHGRRVRWATDVQPYTFSHAVFGRGQARLGLVTHPDLLDYARRVVNSPPFGWQHVALCPLPPEEPLLDPLPPQVADLVGHALDLQQLYWDVQHFGDLPAEHELVAHYVVPLLREWGWPMERIAVEWRRVDVAVFRALPRTPENLHFIVEAKRLDKSAEGALQQAQDYLTALGVRRDIVVTDGLRYRLYAADRNHAPVAYANLARPKASSTALFDRIKRP